MDDILPLIRSSYNHHNLDIQEASLRLADAVMTYASQNNLSLEESTFLMIQSYENHWADLAEENDIMQEVVLGAVTNLLEIIYKLWE